MVDIYKAWHEYDNNITISKNAATSLMLGLITDTGRFRYRGLTSEVLNNAGYLIDLGVDVESLYNKLYVDEVATLKLQGYVLNNFKNKYNGLIPQNTISVDEYAKDHWSSNTLPTIKCIASTCFFYSVFILYKTESYT